MGKRRYTGEVRATDTTDTRHDVWRACSFILPHPIFHSPLLLVFLKKVPFLPFFSWPGLCKSREACWVRLFLRQPGDEARLWRDRDDAHARAGDSLPIGCGGGRKRKRCRLSEEGAQRGFGVPACHGEVWGARGGFAEHTACCKSGREHKSGRRVGSGGDR